MNNIDSTMFKKFIRNAIGTSLDKHEAKALDMEKEYTERAEELDVEDIDIDDFSDEILEKFAVAYTTEADKKAEAKDKEKEK